MDTLSAGVTYTTNTGTAYALPPVAVVISFQGAGTLQVSNDNATWASMSTTAPAISSNYIRSTSGSNIIRVERM